MAPKADWLARPGVMGILNLTPDSFSDGGRHLDPGAALARLAEVAEEGAAIVDIGAESTRPGALSVPEDEQLRRMRPFLEAVAGGGTPVPLSVDTTRGAVALAALEAGAVMVNDVSAGRDDAALLPLVAERGVHLCLMHMRGTPATMQDDPVYRDVVEEVRDFLAGRAEAAMAAGVAEERIVLDPGIGFGKTMEHNLALLHGLDRIAGLGRPVLIGVSRKGMFGPLLGREVGERLAGSLAAALAALARGARIIRAHDVRETVDALRVWEAVRAG